MALVQTFPSEAGYVSEAFRLVFPRRYRRRWVLMLRAYLDASQSQRGTRIMCLAGYVAPLENWERFEHRWRRLLRQADLDHFHMTDFMAGRSAPYRDWSVHKRDHVLRRLVEAITAHVSSGVVSVLYRDAYDALPEPIRQMHFRSEYTLCSTGCIAGAADALMRSRSTESIAYVFELGDVGSGRCVESINALLSRETGYGSRYRVLSAHLENKRQAVGLQAADMLAFVVRRAAQFHALPDARLLPLVKARPVAYRELNHEVLSALARGITLEHTDVKKAAFDRLFVRPQRKRRPAKDSRSSGTEVR